MKVKITSTILGAPRGEISFGFLVGNELEIAELKEENGKWYATESKYKVLWFPLSSTDWAGNSTGRREGAEYADVC
jgi:hypothetical protein